MADSTHIPDLKNLRRFSLVIGLSLILYSSTGLLGIEIDENEAIRPLGIPLKIDDAIIFPTILIIFSVVTTARFFFFGIIVAGTPRRKRKELWRSLRQLPATDAARESKEKIIGELKSLYSNFFGVAPIYRTGGEDDIPPFCKFLAFLQSADYTSPIWINVLAWFSVVLAKLTANQVYSL